MECLQECMGGAKVLSNGHSLEDSLTKESVGVITATSGRSGLWKYFESWPIKGIQVIISLSKCT
jgi:hypothetical protein